MPDPSDLAQRPSDPPLRAPPPIPPAAPSTRLLPASTASLEAPGYDGEPAEGAEGADALREDIERTRDRMAHTLDRIEDRLVRRRDELWSKATLRGARRTVASEPWRGLLIAFAAGYVLAALRD